VVAAIRHEHTTRRTFGLFAPVHQRMVDERLGSVLDKVRPEWVPRAFDATEDSAEHPHLNYALSILRRWARQGGPDDRDAAERSRHDRQSQGPVRSDRDPYAAYTLNAADWDDPPGQSAV
jgi:DNA replication protein DnaD